MKHKLDDRTAWDVYFASICSFRFHPRNDGGKSDVENVEFAATVADMMLEMRRERFE